MDDSRKWGSRCARRLLLIQPYGGATNRVGGDTLHYSGIYRLLIHERRAQIQTKKFFLYLFVKIEERVKARGEIIELNELSGVG